MEKLTSRKFWFAIGLTVLITVLVWYGKINSSDYVEALLFLFAIYSGANVATKFTSKKGDDD